MYILSQDKKRFAEYKKVFVSKKTNNTKIEPTAKTQSRLIYEIKKSYGLSAIYFELFRRSQK